MIWFGSVYSIGIRPSVGDTQYEAQKIDSTLAAALAEAAPTEQLPVIVHLLEQADLSLRDLPEATLARRVAVVERLQETAVSTQPALLQELDALAGNGRVSQIRPFWIVNAVAVHADSIAVQALATRADVAVITLDEAVPLVAPLHPSLPNWAMPAAPTNGETTWGVARIRAPYAWYGLGLDGSGVTVAIMDSGVDWTHPALLANYRGNLGNGVYEHAGNWYQAAIPTLTEPVDLIGHGTHVAGTAVGQNGLGVAPGARWIAVGISDSDGLIYDSAIHAGFEWLLAPDGDPALAPDVINNSWGSSLGVRTEFYADLQVLQMAGIMPVFSAGNNGPESGTINSPASITSTLAVAASDDIDAVAWFSSRGPSPLTDEVKPWLAAPGTHVLSTFPGGQYAVANGTSMAAPHVTGALSLLLQANPMLSPADAIQLLAQTAVSMTATHPNNDSGWGRLDAYLAAAMLVDTGRIQGVVTRDGLPLP
ncbi:MAG: S8 family serine peptidase, partial [Ardenticatenaceae bacterium]|nr:S8 family serine peptidase [Ardenticatenaceae bacterium]